MAELSNQQSTDYIGKGISFPLRVNVQSNINLSSNTYNIEESMRMILGTKLGERVYRPDFGSRLDELVFAPMNSQTLLLIRLYVTEALERWEPRIILNGVYTDVVGHGKLKINIKYTPKNTQEPKSFVYPFYILSPN
ncbi:GPW/gp25 family protein [Anabaena sp. FACHB-1237]|uniref:GPW/gp25 family protein n=1 Tax=Anabaena sp. FACHB-1237 TaxID=2692769 RepID=UPI0016803DDD|nr:GPW/gp25 family protein [Anabaena sp. FACHB-1237]MBD2137764.1 GPW/gp25 family protein [Anabaena sp. FACHB-1237]